MPDQNDLNKPDLDSNYQTEVLQTIKAHFVRLWKQNYRGMANLVAGMRRIEIFSEDRKAHIRVFESTGHGSAENKVFDSKDLLATGTEDIPGLDEKLSKVHEFGKFTLKAENDMLRIYHENNLIWQIDAAGNTTAEQDVTGKKQL